MNLNASDISTGRAFTDETGYDASSASRLSVLLRVAGSFSGGIVVTALLAAIVNH